MSGWGIFFAAFGVSMGLAALVLLVIDLMKSRKTTGTVIGNKSAYAADSLAAEVYAPTIRFKTEAGETRTFQSICYFSSDPHPKGDPIPVRYHPTNKKLNGINRLIPRFFLIVIFGFFGLAFISLGMQI
ncbi:MAG: DUF3592 domain-containing protein [Planctomycetota bacterium]